MITGRLTKADMRRLEHACSRALIWQSPDLEIHIAEVTFVDATAAAILSRLMERGVHVIDSSATVTPRTDHLRGITRLRK